MKRPQLVSHGTLNRILQSAEQAWRRRDFQENIDLLERASRLAPADPGILLQLGRMHGLRWNYAAAEQCFERAVRFAPRKGEILVLAGIQCRDFRRPELAEHYFRCATEQKDTKPEALAHLAELCERLRNGAEASRLVDQALQIDPHCPRAVLARARLDRQAGHLDRAEKSLRSFPQQADKELRVRAGYELGGILDRQGRYKEAMSAFLEAKALVRPEADRHTAELRLVRDRLKRMRESITAEVLQGWFKTWSDPALPRRLTLLCGHPRSGTTLLEQVLDSHSGIISAEETEIFHDFAYVPLSRLLPEESYMLSVLESATPESIQHSREAYFQAMELLLGQPLNGRMLVDKNPSLTFLIPAMVRIFPESKLIVALRDPRDVCLSCFMQPFYPIGPTTSAYLSLSDAVEEYAALMSIWTTLAPLLSGRYLQVHYEHMVEDLESTARQTLEFIGLPWEPQVLRFNDHAQQKIVRSPTYMDVTKPVFKSAVGRWHHYREYLAPYLGRLAPFAKTFGYE